MVNSTTTTPFQGQPRLWAHSNISLPVSSSLIRGPLTPWATILMGPLQHLQMPIPSSRRTRVHIPPIAILMSPFQAFKMPMSSRLSCRSNSPMGSHWHVPTSMFPSAPLWRHLGMSFHSMDSHSLGPIQGLPNSPFLVATEEHVLSFHGQPFSRAHLSKSKWPPPAA